MAQKQFIKKTSTAAIAAPAPAPKPKGKKADLAPPPSPPSIPDDTGGPTPARRKFQDLPVVSLLPRPEMDKAVGLMKEDIDLQRQEVTIKSRRAEIKTELAAIASKRKLPGMLWGRIAVYYNGFKTKWSMDRGKLLEAGVTPEQLKAGLKESKPYVDLRVVDLDKPKKGKGGGEEDDGD